MDIKKKRQYSLIGMAIIIVVVLLIPFKVPYTLKVFARIYPSQVWTISRDGAGAFYSELTNNLTGLKNEFTNFEFERGDIANLHINDVLLPYSLVKKGDTVATISSLLLEEQISNLTSELEIEYATLEASKTGSKISDIKVIDEELVLARQKYDQEQRKFNRINTLYTDSIVPYETFEATQDNMKVAEIEMKILERRLASAKTGEKPASINLIMAKINSLNQRIKYLQDRQLNYSIVSPITGRVDFSESNSTLISISNTKNYIVSAPVKLSYRKYIDSNSEIELNVGGLTDVVKAKNVKLESQIGQIDNQQVVMMKTLIPESPMLSTGMLMECKINCEPVTLIEYFKRSIKIVL